MLGTVPRDERGRPDSTATPPASRCRPRPDFFALLQYCAQLHAETDGASTSRAASLGRCRAAARQEGREPTAAELDAARALVGFERVWLDPALGTVSLLTAGAVVSFGAIAKGYAVDRMGQVLRAREVSHALVSAGGTSLLAIGGRDSGWSVAVRSDRPDKPLRLWLKDGALGTSGSGEQFVIVNGRRHGRVVDPRTGQHPRGVRSATVITADATTADALSAAFLVSGARRRAGILRAARRHTRGADYGRCSGHHARFRCLCRRASRLASRMLTHPERTGQNAKCKVQSAKCKVQSAKCTVQSARVPECRMNEFREAFSTLHCALCTAAIAFHLDA